MAVDLRTQINNAIHHVVMEYSYSEENYGINKIPMVIFNGNIYKALKEDIPAGVNPTSSNDFWQIISSFSTVNKKIVKINANFDIKKDNPNYHLLCNSELAPFDVTLPPISEIEDTGFSFGISVYGRNSVTVTASPDDYIANDLSSIIVNNYEKYELLADVTSNSWIITMQETPNRDVVGSIGVGFRDVDGYLYLDTINTALQTIDIRDYNMETDKGDIAFFITDNLDIRYVEKTLKGITID